MTNVTVLSGGVGGARLARGLDNLDDVELHVVVNVGDDDVVYGLNVSPDIDTVLYTLADVEGPRGWGIEGDRFEVMNALTDLGHDTTFRIGDRDLATNLLRTELLRGGAPLSEVATLLAAALNLQATIHPATDDPLRTMIRVPGEEWLRFQEYFVARGHRDEVLGLRFDGAEQASPAPGVLEAIGEADLVVIAPSNPPLSIWPILAVPGIADAVRAAPRVIGVSPLFAGRALKGPAHRVLRSLGFPQGNLGVLAAYDGLLDDFVIDLGDAPDRSSLTGHGARIHVWDTRIADPAAATDFGRWLIGLL